MRDFFNWFYYRVIKRVPPLPYVPQLAGMRPLRNGRLALAYWSNKREYNEEVRIFDLWSFFKDRKEEDPISKWYNIEFFNRVYIYGGAACWSGISMLALSSDWLYDVSILVEEDFECVV